MKRIRILTGAVLALAIAAHGQVSNPSIITVASDPTGVACTGGLPNEQYNGTMFTCKGGVWTASAAAAQWTRQTSPFISPYPTDPSQQVQEPSCLLDTSPEILTGYTQVAKCTWTDGWWNVAGGGTGVGICFGESPDGITPPTRSNPCPIAATTNYARSWLMKNPVGAGYILYASNTTSGTVSQFTGSTVAGLTLAHSGILSCGSNGTETGQVGNTAVWYDAGQARPWRMLYDCMTTASSPNSWVDWLATSTDGFTWTKFQTTPVIGYGSTAAIANCEDCAGAWVGIVNGVLNAYAHGGPVGQVPTPYIYHFIDTSGVGNAWVADPSPAITARTFQEGVNNSQGQIADAFLLDMGANNQSILYFAAYQNGCSGQTTCAYPSYIEAATINEPLSTVLTQQLTDGPTMFSLISPGYVSAPESTLSSGSRGQWSINGSYLYAYDQTTGLWGRSTLTVGWGLQDFASFSGTAATPLSSYTTLDGFTFALNNQSGVTPTMPELDGNGYAYVPSGTSTTFGDVIDTVTPSSADYTIGATFNYVGAAGDPLAALFARQSTTAQTFYQLQCVPAAPNKYCQLYKGVAGVFTQLGSNYAITWTTGSSHKLTLKVLGTAISTTVDGQAAIIATDSAVSAAGSAGFRVTGAGGMKATKWFVQ